MVNLSPGKVGCLKENSDHPFSIHSFPNASTIVSEAHPHTVTPPTNAPAKPYA